MKKLIEQILKFGVVGVLCFFIDFGLYTICNMIFKATGVSETFTYYYLVSGIVGFAVSMIVNYLLSMKFVFERKDDISRTREFVTFFVLSVIGMGINELILYLGIEVIYTKWTWMQSWMSVSFRDTFFKLAATGIVMVYNFITRKIFLEKKD